MKNNRWLRLGLGAFALFFAGIIYAWSVIKAPFAAFGWSGSQLGLNYTITMSMFCLGGLFSGLLNQKISSKIRMAVSGALVAGGFALTSTLTAENPVVLLYLGYGIMAGLGIGVVYNVVIALTSAWFPDKKGVCSGVLMMAFGFSSFVLGNVAAKLFANADFGWSKTYLVYGILIGAVIIVCGLFIRAPKPEELPAVTKKTNTEQRDFTAAEMLKRPSFWQLFLFFILFSAVGSVTLAFGKDILLSGGLAEGMAVTLASLLAIFNGFGRLASGAVFDALGIRKTQYITSAVAIAASGLALLGVATKVSALVVIGVALCAFSYGFSPTVSAAFSNAFYGPKNFSLNYALLNLILIPSAFYATIAGKIVDASGSFVAVFALLLVCSLVGLVDNLTIKKA